MVSTHIYGGEGRKPWPTCMLRFEHPEHFVCYFLRAKSTKAVRLVNKPEKVQSELLFQWSLFFVLTL
jgi:hypothetical protein